MADLTQAVNVAVSSQRGTQEAAEPTQALDSTSIWRGLIPGYRAADPTPTDVNTSMAKALL